MAGYSTTRSTTNAITDFGVSRHHLHSKRNRTSITNTAVFIYPIQLRNSPIRNSVPALIEDKRVNLKYGEVMDGSNVKIFNNVIRTDFVSSKFSFAIHSSD
jgi:hypothetical protein